MSLIFSALQAGDDALRFFPEFSLIYGIVLAISGRKRCRSLLRQLRDSTDNFPTKGVRIGRRHRRLKQQRRKVNHSLLLLCTRHLAAPQHLDFWNEES